jgi:hypothetical protein
MPSKASNNYKPSSSHHFDNYDDYDDYEDYCNEYDDYDDFQPTGGIGGSGAGGRDNKRQSVAGSKNNIYSAKHVRAKEAMQQQRARTKNKSAKLRC